jgi:hypothetical protein
MIGLFDEYTSQNLLLRNFLCFFLLYLFQVQVFSPIFLFLKKSQFIPSHLSTRDQVLHP